MFQIDPASRVPIYEQLIRSAERLVNAGVLKPHDQLPSVRALAIELGVNPNTVAKAYRELESLGLTYSVTGKGSFIREPPPGEPDTRQKEALSRFCKACEDALREGVPAARLRQIIDETDKGGRKHD